MKDEVLPKLVVIDDEPDMARLIADVADMSGYSVAHYFDARKFVFDYADDAGEKDLNFVSGFRRSFRFDELHALLIKLQVSRAGI